MPEYEIEGTLVKFPFEAYAEQREYMEKVILCLKFGTNGILESPAGSGKTLSLLCSTLAWLQSNKGTKIIYASRTHSQLKQAMQELKRTSYSFVKALVLGSRNELCIHPDVKKEQFIKTQKCKVYTNLCKCSFYRGLENPEKKEELLASSIMDIEDLVKLGEKLTICPYYGERLLVEKADIIFMPYNYLLDPSVREVNNIQLSNAICILDEAHNIGKMCEEYASAEIELNDISETVKILNILKESEEIASAHIEFLNSINSLALCIEQQKNQMQENKIYNGEAFPASFIYNLLEKVEINFDSKEVINFLDMQLNTIAGKSERNENFKNSNSIQKLSKFLTTVFNYKSDSVDNSFKVYMDLNGNVSFVCLNPAIVMGQFLNQNPRSVILTSGTLSPLNHLEAELCLPVGQRLNNPPIMSSSQVYAKIIHYGINGVPFNSELRKRVDVFYIESLGLTIKDVAGNVPKGLLVFFPSYKFLNMCKEIWETSGLNKQISSCKPIYREPKTNGEFNKTMESFNQSIQNPKGACFFAVCRGKGSEGLNFIDCSVFTVIIIGVPYAKLSDPNVFLKMKYLDDNRTNGNNLLSGSDWYSLEAKRVVYHAIGRIIRHRNYYGAILLFDERFKSMRMSEWIPNIESSSYNNEIREELKEFFNRQEKNALVSGNNEVREEFTEFFNTEENNALVSVNPSTSDESCDNTLPSSIDATSSSIDFATDSSTSLPSCSKDVVNINKRAQNPLSQSGSKSDDIKKKKSN